MEPKSKSISEMISEVRQQTIVRIAETRARLNQTSPGDPFYEAYQVVLRANRSALATCDKVLAREAELQLCQTNGDPAAAEATAKRVLARMMEQK